MLLEILYQDEHLIAINKPHGLLVHRSALARDVHEFALQLLKNQIGKWVNPTHRIDRKTAGVLLFALDKQTEKLMQTAFAKNEVQKKYLAILRGHTLDYQEIDYPLHKENGALQDAFTAFKTLQRAELDIPLGAHPTSRYSLVEAKPTTGRMHQLRKHFSHIFHPIIGDRTHGCNKQNRMFKERWQMETMMLHAAELSFVHPVYGNLIVIKAPLQNEFSEVVQLMGWQNMLV
ncbi:pseudouridine synthase [Mucilaginibacter sp.]|uniref:pseudouridine synthase n=1 Tax=Mucilaginibacter sp. TaxID=1882438 RepID=UPI003B001B74